MSVVNKLSSNQTLQIIKFNENNVCINDSSENESESEDWRANFDCIMIENENEELTAADEKQVIAEANELGEKNNGIRVSSLIIDLDSLKKRCNDKCDSEDLKRTEPDSILEETERKTFENDENVCKSSKENKVFEQALAEVVKDESCSINVLAKKIDVQSTKWKSSQKDDLTIVKECAKMNNSSDDELKEYNLPPSVLVINEDFNDTPLPKNNEICVISEDDEDTNTSKNDPVERSFYSCDICKIAFLKLRSLKQHMRSHKITKKQFFYCSKCHLSFGSQEGLDRHGECYDEPEETYLCDKCGRCFTNKTHLQLHCKTHSAFSCAICQKGFKHKINLDQHLKTHSDGFPMVCKMCHAKFENPFSLQKHTRKHLRKNAKDNCCDICQRTFLSARALERHTKVHGSGREEQMTCNLCHSMFNSMNKLKEHRIKGHPKVDTTQGNELVCDFCQQKFNRLDEFQAHMKVHAVDAPFSCGVCQKIFSRYTSLKEHLKTCGSWL